MTRCCCILSRRYWRPSPEHNSETPLTLATLLLPALMQVVHGQEQQLARIGDLRLESGKIIRDCVVGYRTLGRLNKNKSNAVLFPTAFGWRSAELASRVGPDKLINDAKYFVIVVDSLGDGISSSPSTSDSQPRLDFPEFSIRDMVSAERAHTCETKRIGEAVGEFLEK